MALLAGAAVMPGQAEAMPTGALAVSGLERVEVGTAVEPAQYRYYRRPYYRNHRRYYRRYYRR